MNNQQIAALKPQLNKQYSVSGLGVAGLSITISYGGAKVFYYRYRNKDGKQKRMKLGKYPSLTLAKAREAAMRLSVEVNEGNDPVAIKKEIKRTKDERTIKTVGELWEDYREYVGLKKRSAEFEFWLWKKHVADAFADIPIEEFNRVRIVKFLNIKRMEKSAHLANRIQSLLTRLATHGVERLIFDRSPAHDLGRKPKEHVRERVLDQDELKLFWMLLHDPDQLQDAKISMSMAQALKLAALTLCRRSEIAGARWEEVDFKTEEFIIPRIRVKNNQTHIVPLSKQAVETLYLAREFAFKQNDYVFASPRNDTHFIPSAITRACRRFCSHFEFTPFTPHDLRRTGATTLASSQFKISRFILSRVINHKSETGGASAMFRAYDHNDYAEEKRNALDVWGRYLESLLDVERTRSGQMNSNS